MDEDLISSDQSTWSKADRERWQALPWASRVMVRVFWLFPKWGKRMVRREMDKEDAFAKKGEMIHHRVDEFLRRHREKYKDDED